MVNRSEETAVTLDVNLGSGGSEDGDLEMYYRILKADQRSFERLVLSENMISVSGGMSLQSQGYH